MNKHVCTLGIGVVGDYETCWCGVVGARRRREGRVKRLDKLSSLRAWSCAHVENKVVRLHIKEERWKHRDGLLSAD